MILHISDRHIVTSTVNHPSLDYHFYNNGVYEVYPRPLDEKHSFYNTPTEYAADVSVVGVEHLWGQLIPRIK